MESVVGVQNLKYIYKTFLIHLHSLDLLHNECGRLVLSILIVCCLNLPRTERVNWPSVCVYFSYAGVPWFIFSFLSVVSVISELLLCNLMH